MSSQMEAIEEFLLTPVGYDRLVGLGRRRSSKTDPRSVFRGTLLETTVARRQEPIWPRLNEPKRREDEKRLSIRLPLLWEINWQEFFCGYQPEEIKEELEFAERQARVAAEVRLKSRGPRYEITLKAEGIRINVSGLLKERKPITTIQFYSSDEFVTELSQGIKIYTKAVVRLTQPKVRSLDVPYVPRRSLHL